MWEVDSDRQTKQEKLRSLIFHSALIFFHFVFTNYLQ